MLMHIRPRLVREDKVAQAMNCTEASRGSRSASTSSTTNTSNYPDMTSLGNDRDTANETERLTTTTTSTPTSVSRQDNALRTRRSSIIAIRFCAGDSCTSQLRSVEDYFCSVKCARSRSKHSVYDKYVDANASTSTVPTTITSTNIGVPNESRAEAATTANTTATCIRQAVGMSGSSSNSSSAVTTLAHDRYPFHSWRHGELYQCHLPGCRSPAYFINTSALKYHLLRDHNTDIHDYEKQWVLSQHLNTKALSS
jgi:hypothetical protein